MLSAEKQNALKNIPPMNEILDNEKVIEYIKSFGKEAVTENINESIEAYRNEIIKATDNAFIMNSREAAQNCIIEKLGKCLQKYESIGLKRVINATGIVLHTNLGRAPLPEKAAHLMNEISTGYCNLEFDLDLGKRGSRHSHVEALISKITGAESAVIVNNNAAAVFLCLNTLATNREVVISRGQQVEIGGSFRIPDIIARSGATMHEVGTTNKTRLSDYSGAINEATAVLLKVHTSNYKITGFTEEVELKELVKLGRDNNVVVMEDLGSGSLYDLTKIGLPYEPTVQDSIENGADLVTFSGDKLLGGPQAGIIAGKKALIDKIKKNPLMRMLRCDKNTIAATIAVLSLYLDMDRVTENIPAIGMMAMQEEELSDRALELNSLITKALGQKCLSEIVDDLDEVGGGSLPGIILRGKAVAINSYDLSVNDIQAGLRAADVPVVCRISRDRVLINVRTIDKKDYPEIVKALSRIFR